MNSNTTIVLVAAAFSMIGFILGRVKSQGHLADGRNADKVIGDGGEVSSDIQVVIKAFEEGDFDGDTSFSHPVGRIPEKSQRSKEMQVEVEMEEASDGVST
jgi:hypothetical protein